MSEVIEFADFGETLDLVLARPGFSMRPYQIDSIGAIERAFDSGVTRQILVLATGLGKTVVFSQITKREVERGGRVLILAHTDELLEQAIDKLYRSAGIEADKEKANDHASLDAKVVVASIQTLARVNRLLGFPEDHFTLVIVDETHRALAPIYQRVLRYFHYGALSLDEAWVPPEHGVPYKHLARVLGVTATADRGDNRSLGEFFQTCSYEFGLLEACRDGWLVRPIAKSIPLKIDLKRHSAEEKVMVGGDYSADFIVQRMRPFIRAIAEEIQKNAGNRKTVCFLPSIETARLMSEALLGAGLAAEFVSGACDDRDEKLAWFDKAHNGSAICCAMLLTEGWDCPSASCIVVLRPTKIRALLTQCVGRGTRTLPGVIDGLETKEERLAAIAASDKPTLLILDFLWLTDRLDLVKAIDLVATKPGVREQVKEPEEGEEVDLLDAEALAERDLLKSLEKAVKANARKAARVIDPIAFAMSLGDTALANWEPSTKWDGDPATAGQLNFLRGQGIDVTNIKYKGLAAKVITKVMERLKHKLATPKQLTFMLQLGIPEERAVLLTQTEATAAIDATLAEKKARRASPPTDDPPGPQSS